MLPTMTLTLTAEEDGVRVTVTGFHEFIAENEELKRAAITQIFFNYAMATSNGHNLQPTPNEVH